MFLGDSIGRDSWRLAPGFPQTSPHEPFPFPDFALYPFAVINYSHEHYTLSPHQTWGRFWEPWTLVFIGGGSHPAPVTMLED